jgi:hypothetical protein
MRTECLVPGLALAAGCKVLGAVDLGLAVALRPAGGSQNSDWLRRSCRALGMRNILGHRILGHRILL